MYRAIVSAFVLVTTVCALTSVVGSELTFTKIIDTSQVIPSTLEQLRSFQGASSFGEAVAFTGEDGLGNIDVYKYVNGHVEKVADDTGLFGSRLVSIDETSVWFAGAVNGQRSLWRATDGMFTPYGTFNGGFGTVAHSGDKFVYLNHSESSIVKVVDGAETIVAKAYDPVPGVPGAYPDSYLSGPHGPSMDGANVAFLSSARWTQSSSNFGNYAGIYAQLDGNLVQVLDSRLTTIPDGTGVFDTRGGIELLGFDKGVVAFWGIECGYNVCAPDRQEGIYTVVPGELPKKVADRNTLAPGGSDKFFSFGESRSANSTFTNGNLIFGAWTDEVHSNSLYRYNIESGFLSKVIGPSSLLDGKKVSSVWMGRESGDNDSFAFAVGFEDGEQAIYRGDFKPKSRRHLVLVTHGYNDDANGWVKDVQGDMWINLHLDAEGDTTIEKLDWSAGNTITHVDANGESDIWEVVSFDWNAPFAGSPLYAIWNANRVGTALGQELAKFDYQSVHLIGHSAGSWLIDAVADQLGANTDVHETFLDAYTPGISEFMLGDSADWADHYVHDGSLPSTNDTIFNAFNVDITALQPEMGLEPVAGHSFPRQWYRATTENPENVTAFGWGAQLTKEVQGRHPFYGETVNGRDVFRNRRIDILSGSSIPVLTPMLTNVEGLITTENTSISSTGSVTDITADGFGMATGSPVWLSAEIAFAQAVNQLSFNYEFSSSTLGELSVLFENEIVFVADEEFSEGVESSGRLWLGNDFAPGTYTLLFLLQSGSDIQSALKVSDIEFTFVSVVPEPGTANLALVVALAICGVRIRPKLCYIVVPRHLVKEH